MASNNPAQSRVIRWGWLAALALLWSCGSSKVPSVPAGGKDSGVEDGGLSKCKDAEVYLNGKCQPDPCKDSTLACDQGMECAAFCVPDVPLCRGVECADKQTCVNGQCVDGCYEPDFCKDMDCDDGQTCVVRDGYPRCVVANDCDASCPKDTHCITRCSEPLPDPTVDRCKGVVCKTGQICDQGKCVDSPCAGLSCNSVSICRDSACFDTCNCGDCDGPGAVCVLGECRRPGCAGVCPPDAVCGERDSCGAQCIGTCPDDLECRAVGMVVQCTCKQQCDGKTCGDDDGCGGACTACENPNATCRLNEVSNADGGGDGGTHIVGECCLKQCDFSMACGADDGCGGTCNGTCPDHYECLEFKNNSFECTCAPACAGAACGDPNGCGGECPGSCAAPKTTCIPVTPFDYECQCVPYCLNKACGADDGCGGKCNGSCPAGKSCGTDYVCHAACEPACGCGQQCSNGSCVPLCDVSSTLCGCGLCCTSAEICQGGACVPLVGPG